MHEFTKLPLSMPLSIALRGRCSVRGFKPDVVDRLQVQTLLAAAVRAPTAMHQESWAFVVVQDKPLLKHISNQAKPLLVQQMKRLHVERRGQRSVSFSDPEFNIFHNAGTLIVICGTADAPFIAADCWLAAENLMLAAYAMGLGACVIGSAAAALNLEQVKRDLQIPEAYTAVAPIVVGVPSIDEMPTARKVAHILYWQ